MLKEKISVLDLKSGYIVFGNKGDVWNNNSHIFKGGEGVLCGIPALSTNWSMYEGVTEIGCQKCIEKYNQKEE